MNKIQSYQDMLALENQLESDLAVKGALIRTDIAQLKEEWRPIVGMISGIGRLTSTVKTHPLLSIGMGLLADVLQKNIVVASGGWITRLIGPYLAKSFSSRGSTFLNRIINKLKQ